MSFYQHPKGVVVAEREGHEIFMFNCTDKATAEQRIEFMERHGGWPEGYDAVFNFLGNRWLYTSPGQWELIQ